LGSPFGVGAPTTKGPPQGFAPEKPRRGFGGPFFGLWFGKKGPGGPVWVCPLGWGNLTRLGVPFSTPRGPGHFCFPGGPGPLLGTAGFPFGTFLGPGPPRGVQFHRVFGPCSLVGNRAGGPGGKTFAPPFPRGGGFFCSGAQGLSPAGPVVTPLKRGWIFLCGPPGGDPPSPGAGKEN